MRDPPFRYPPPHTPEGRRIILELQALRGLATGLAASIIVLHAVAFFALGAGPMPRQGSEGTIMQAEKDQPPSEARAGGEGSLEERVKRFFAGIAQAKEALMEIVASHPGGTDLVIRTDPELANEPTLKPDPDGPRKAIRVVRKEGSR